MATKIEARITTREGAEKFVARHSQLQALRQCKPCTYGHWDCSTYRDGPCLDETLANFPED